jgi:hypothetical protein
MFAFVAEFISNEGPLAQKLKWLRMVGTFLWLYRIKL